MPTTKINKACTKNNGYIMFDGYINKQIQKTSVEINQEPIKHKITKNNNEK